MKRLAILMAMVVLILSLSTLVMGEDSKEVLILKREVVMLKLQNLEMQLTTSASYQALVKELKGIDERLKAMEPKKEVPKEDKKPK